MQTNLKSIFSVGCLLALVLVAMAYRGAEAENAKAWVEADAELKAVDVNMHDFMEGMFQAPYLRLKATMASEPKDNRTWKALRSDALIMAEGSNLLLIRKPEKEVASWNQYSIDSRDAGAAIIKAAKKKDFAGATDAYKKMIVHCNACHQEFNEGKNQLTP